MHVDSPGTQTRPVAIIALCALLLAGCAQTRVVLWTDHAEAAPAVELFNAAQDQYVVELRYSPDMGRTLRQEESAADIVIAGAIEDASTVRHFRPLDRLFARMLDRESFYADLLENGERSGRQLLLPVSFNLPVVYFLQGSAPASVGISIEPQQMQELGREFNRIVDGTASQISYSPLWNADFLYELVRFHGFNVRESPTLEPEWQLEGLVSGVTAAREWVTVTNGGLDVDSEFRDQYLYDPVERLVRQGRVQFGYDTSESFFKRSDASSSDLDFRWFGTSDGISTVEHIVYAGIPDRTTNLAGARAFLAWFFHRENQATLVSSNLKNRVDSFGVVGGLSSLWTVTERVIPREYPRLEGMIPPADWLQFPPALPRHWDRLVEPVVERWLLREVSGQPQTRDLEETVTAWLLQQEN